MSVASEDRFYWGILALLSNWADAIGFVQENFVWGTLVECSWTARGKRCGTAVSL